MLINNWQYEDSDIKMPIATTNIHLLFVEISTCFKCINIISMQAIILKTSEWQKASTYTKREFKAHTQYSSFGSTIVPLFGH